MLTSSKQSVVWPSLFYKFNMHIKRVLGHTKHAVLACCEPVITFIPVLPWMVTNAKITIPMLEEHNVRTRASEYKGQGSRPLTLNSFLTQLSYLLFSSFKMVAALNIIFLLPPAKNM